MPRNGRTTTPENQAQQRAGTPMPGAHHRGAATLNPEPLTQPHSPAQLSLTPVTVPSSAATLQEAASPSQQPNKTIVGKDIVTKNGIVEALTRHGEGKSIAALLGEARRQNHRPEYNSGRQILTQRGNSVSTEPNRYKLLHADVQRIMPDQNNATSQYQYILTGALASQAMFRNPQLGQHHREQLEQYKQQCKNASAPNSQPVTQPRPRGQS